MKDFAKFSKYSHMKAPEIILTIVFIIYIVLGYDTPEPIANVLDTVLGKFAILIVLVYMFLNTNPILAVISLFVAFDLLRRSSIATGYNALMKYAPSEIKKTSQFTAFNQFPYTLEQEVVKQMAPIVKTGSSLTKSSYTPMLENNYDASPIN